MKKLDNIDQLCQYRSILSEGHQSICSDKSHNKICNGKN